jgi:oxygen-independent coproporphyrinogen-3 oxidase
VPHERYADAVIRELVARRAQFRGGKLISVYFGGGTPGLWAPAQLRRVLDAVVESFELLEDPLDAVGGNPPLEVTVEINPRRAPVETLTALRNAGANRLSVGCQSFDDRYLRALGRDHDAGQALATLQAAGDAGWSRVNLDLIYGGPEHSMEVLESDLAVAGEAAVDHISTYQLTVHAGTPFARQRAAGKLRIADDKESVVLDARCDAVLTAAGFWRYEVSNYAREGGVARHNSLYWTGAEYMGLGVGAHELCIRGGEAHRREGVRTVRQYLESSSAAGDAEVLDARTHMGERLFTALRTSFGVKIESLASQFGTVLASEAADRLRPLVDEGYLHTVSGAVPGVPTYLCPDGERIVPTARGIRFADSVGARVV